MLAGACLFISAIASDDFQLFDVKAGRGHLQVFHKTFCRCSWHHDVLLNLNE